ncbi:MAG: SH3 domain-containing protein [Pararhodobacter sp.]
MRNLIGAVAAFMLFLSGSVALSDEFPSLHRVVGVAHDDVLNIRAEPNARSEIIGSFEPGETGVEVIALSDDGRWGRVNSGERAGWSHMRYLARDMPGSWRDGATALSCFGTEPFWRMEFFLPTHRAEFHGVNEGGFELVTDAGALPATRFPPTLAVPFSGTREGMAVMRGEACNDGMSDMDFGISVLIYWRRDTEGLSGCCSLN